MLREQGRNLVSYFPPTAGFEEADGSRRYTAICMMVILVIVSVAAWPASFVVGAETSSLCLRARTQGLGGSVANLTAGALSIVLPYLYNPDQGNIGAKIGFVFAAFCGIGAFLAWKSIPELKDRAPTEIDEMFELRLQTKAFKHWVSASAS